jgi:uncharacterized membrane protein YphA (DoxX/SURF4 family)
MAGSGLSGAWSAWSRGWSNGDTTLKTKAIAYWIATGILVLAILSGGVAELAQRRDNVEGMALLGYPPYFLTILGLWKVLGSIALLAPGFPRLKEWAYAGIFFNVTGAAASHAAVGDYGIYAFHIVVNLVFAGLAVASWALRPQSRTLGILFPAKTRA